MQRKPQFGRPPSGYLGANGRSRPAPAQPTSQSAEAVQALSDFEGKRTICLYSLKDLYGQAKIETDIASQLKRQDEAKWRRHRLTPRRITSLLLLGGLAEADWLNLRPSSGYCTAWGASDYDLLMSNTDILATVHFAQPVHDAQTGLTRQRLLFALDTTVTFSVQNAVVKLAQSTTQSDTNLPFGFTYPEYVLDQQEALGSVLMPRYLVSVGQQLAYQLRMLVQPPSEPSQPPFDYEGPSMLVRRYRTLLLMWMQNCLYETMLPDRDHYGEQAAMLEEAEYILTQMDGLLRGALDQVIQEIAERELLPLTPQRELLRLLQANRLQAAREVVKKWQLQQAAQQFERFVHLNGIRVKREEADTFVQLVHVTDRLTKLAYAGELDCYRYPQKRHQPLFLKSLKY